VTSFEERTLRSNTTEQRDPRGSENYAAVILSSPTANREYLNRLYAGSPRTLLI